MERSSSSATSPVNGTLVWVTTVTALGFLAVLTPPVMFPAIAADLEIDPGLVSQFGAVTFFAAMLASIVGGQLTRGLGPLRLFQLCMGALALGLALFASGSLPLLCLGAILLGLGYGPVNPLTAALLFARTPEGSRSLFFSIKQSGVALGGAVAGFLVPPLVLLYGWRATLLIFAALLLCTGFAGPRRPSGPETGRSPGSAGQGHKGLAGFLNLLRDPVLRKLALLAFTFNALQTGAATVLVTHLMERVGVGLLEAGLVLGVSQGAGLVGRILWGLVADRTGRARLVLAGLGLVMAAAALAVAPVGPHWPEALLIVIGLVLGITSSGWNGIFLSQVASRAGAGQVASATGACAAFAFAGGMVGPLIYSAAHGLTGGYAMGFAATALLTTATALVLLVPDRQWR